MSQSGISKLNGLQQQVAPQVVRRPKSSDNANALSFKDTLQSQLNRAGRPQNSLQQAEAPLLKFSNHAVERMRTRGVKFSSDELQKIGNAIDTAAKKGAKDTLVLTDKSALVVSVKNNTVVTVMDKNQMKENVFTNIDSTVMI